MYFLRQKTGSVFHYFPSLHGTVNAEQNCTVVYFSTRPHFFQVSKKRFFISSPRGQKMQQKSDFHLKQGKNRK
jgi:hypothetical protein